MTDEIKDFFRNLPRRHLGFIDLDKLVRLDECNYEEIWEEIIGHDQGGIERMRGGWSSEFIAFCLALSWYQHKLRKIENSNE